MDASAGEITLDWVADRCLRVGLGARTSELEHRRVQAAYRRVREIGIAGLLDATPAYSSLLLTFDPLKLDPVPVLQMVRRAIGAGEPDEHVQAGRLVEIPICYERPHAPDIEVVANAVGLSESEVARRHAATEYVVRFVGFTPGFPYLAGLPSELSVAHMERPRIRVPAGSVGIGGDQTGIYPLATPGGWRLIGRTPRRMFDAGREPAALLAMGDRVRFAPITGAEFEAMAKEGR